MLHHTLGEILLSAAFEGPGFIVYEEGAFRISSLCHGPMKVVEIRYVRGSALISEVTIVKVSRFVEGFVFDLLLRQGKSLFVKCTRIR
jgi:hypothetical protein